ncbi:MAG: 4Fe-4S binding protein [Methanomassiliicoccales archaeon]|nr:4Fe-4S binding protein [Methanomassiliicoccales archaeon]
MSEKRIGVFICESAGGSEGSLDLRSLGKHVSSLPEVSFVRFIDQVCKETGQAQMLQALNKDEVDRFVVAACSPLSKERMLMRLAAEAGLNPFMFTIANVREQSAFVHSKAGADLKAKRLLRMAVEKCRLLAPAPYDVRIPDSRTVLVVGDGLRAALAAEDLRALDLEVMILVEEGMLRLPRFLDPTLAEALKRSEEGSPIISGHLASLDGVPGAFDVLTEGKTSGAVRCGAVIIAFDPLPAKLEEGIMGPMHFEELMAGGARLPLSLVIVVDDWKSEFHSPQAMEWAMRTAVAVRTRSPESSVRILCRDISSRGELESEQLRAQRHGTIFMRTERAPTVTPGERAIVRTVDPIVGELALDADAVILVGSDLNAGSASTCFVLGLAMRPDGMPRESKVRLRAGESLRAGIYVIDPWSEWSSGDVRLDCAAVAARAAALLLSPGIEEGGAVAQVEAGKCSACLSCVRICPYGAPYVTDEGKAEVRYELCQGCGMCVTSCPGKAIDMHCYSDAQIAAEGKAALKEPRP